MRDIKIGMLKPQLTGIKMKTNRLCLTTAAQKSDQQWKRKNFATHNKSCSWI